MTDMLFMEWSVIILELPLKYCNFNQKRRDSLFPNNCGISWNNEKKNPLIWLVIILELPLKNCNFNFKKYQRYGKLSPKDNVNSVSVNDTIPLFPNNWNNEKTMICVMIGNYSRTAIEILRSQSKKISKKC